MFNNEAIYMLITTCIVYQIKKDISYIGMVSLNPSNNYFDIEMKLFIICKYGALATYHCFVFYSRFFPSTNNFWTGSCIMGSLTFCMCIYGNLGSLYRTLWSCWKLTSFCLQNDCGW